MQLQLCLVPLLKLQVNLCTPTESSESLFLALSHACLSKPHQRAQEQTPTMNLNSLTQTPTRLNPLEFSLNRHFILRTGTRSVLPTPSAGLSRRVGRCTGRPLRQANPQERLFRRAFLQIMERSEESFQARRVIRTGRMRTGERG